MSILSVNLLVISSLIIIVGVFPQTGDAATNEIIDCYKCLSHERDCEDTFDRSRIATTSCILDGYAFSQNYVKRSFSYLNLEAMQEDHARGIRDTSSNHSKYVSSRNACLKVKISGKDRNGVHATAAVRGCFPDTPTLCQTIRYYVQENSGHLLTVDFCEKCYNDKCNNAVGLSFSILTFVTFIFLQFLS